ncbi:MAG: hypothetical protein COA42_18980 [Alteromonadaceae bacterium]|nr:MAG: hypothetical protein COA42_18980 [Alteromonadaceae bacterium]
MTGITEEHLRDFHNTLDGSGLQALEQGDPYYIPVLKNRQDPILELQQSIHWASSESVNLLSGFRGNGKSTELRRLKHLLTQQDHYVLLVDMNQYINMTKPLDISDFILSLVIAVSEAVKDEFDGLNEGYWERLCQFLSSDVEISSVTATLGFAKLGARLRAEPSFKQQVQQQWDLSVSLDNVGEVAQAQGEWSRAGEMYQQSRDIREKLVERLGETPEGLRDLSISLIKMGDAALAMEEWNKAEKYYIEGRSIVERLKQRFPEIKNYVEMHEHFQQLLQKLEDEKK